MTGAVEALNAEKLVSDHLRSVTGARVVARNPGDDDLGGTADAWVRITKLDVTDLSGGTDYFARYYLQFDCYAGDEGGHPEAEALGNEIRKALRDVALVHGRLLDREGAATQIECSDVDVRSHSRSPDATFKPARERVILTAFVYLHS